MEGVTALRSEAREAILCAGGRGFVRFLSEGDALLISDAPRRSDADALIAALAVRGFDSCARDGLLYITPGTQRLLTLCAAQPQEIIVNWDSARYDVQALCARLLGEAPLPLEGDGKRLVLETARLLWQPQDRVLAGLPALRAAVAVRLRERRRSGLHEAGRLLCGWLIENGN
ncbi:MAG: hypothetical protein IKU34_09995 [Clostridia bacterium]|nr:hypothetical protein [Clostridia bacterium]